MVNGLGTRKNPPIHPSIKLPQKPSSTKSNAQYFSVRENERAAQKHTDDLALWSCIIAKEMKTFFIIIQTLIKSTSCINRTDTNNPHNKYQKMRKSTWCLTCMPEDPVRKCYSRVYNGSPDWPCLFCRRFGGLGTTQFYLEPHQHPPLFNNMIMNVTVYLQEELF